MHVLVFMFQPSSTSLRTAGTFEHVGSITLYAIAGRVGMGQGTCRSR